MQAIATLSVFAVPEVRSLLGAIANSKASDRVRAATIKALIDIESRLAFWNGVGNVFQGISLGSVLLLAAVGGVVTYRKKLMCRQRSVTPRSTIRSASACAAMVTMAPLTTMAIHWPH